MVTHFMLTAPRDTYNKRMLEMMLDVFDIKNWIIAKECGKRGYKHYQVRASMSGNLDDLFEWKSKNGLVWHIEKASAGPFDTHYERKEGAYWTSQDTNDIRKCRFGTPNKWQSNVLKTVANQSDREIDVWLDPHGNHGKTWLAIHLWETGRALVVPRSASTPEKLSAFVCSAWQGEPIIIIDIPRAQKIDPRIYETIEELKDGLVFDHRYSGKTRNIRGTKICIFTNTPLDKGKLSHDRWRLHGIEKIDTVRARGSRPYRNTSGRLPPFRGGVSAIKGPRAEPKDRINRLTGANRNTTSVPVHYLNGSSVLLHSITL